MKNKTLFLDFDGVLFDTLREVYLISRFIYCSKPFLDEIDKNNYDVFSRYKYLVYNIWMFYYFNPIIFGNVSESEIVKRFKNALLKRDKIQEDIFCNKFLDARRQLINNHFDFWKNLEIPYDFFFKIKELHSSHDKNIIVVSKKNKNSILERFRTYDFNIEPNCVFAREILDKYNSKGEFIAEYMKNNNISDAIFVDDNMNNIRTVKDSNVKTILALWGNNEPGDTGYSQQEAINEIEDYFISK